MQSDERIYDEFFFERANGRPAGIWFVLATIGFGLVVTFFPMSGSSEAWTIGPILIERRAIALLLILLSSGSIGAGIGSAWHHRLVGFVAGLFLAIVALCMY